jgi:hypothetical protein
MKVDPPLVENKETDGQHLNRNTNEIDIDNPGASIAGRGRSKQTSECAYTKPDCKYPTQV